MSAGMTEREFAVDVVRRLREAGHEALWAGGCVRDQLLGLTPKDYDVATSALPEAVCSLFRRTVAVGMCFGVVEVLGPRTDRGPLRIQVATFRSDVSYSDGRHPDAVVFSSAREDALRRDFTINGMFYDPLADEVIDYVGGRADLEARVLRAIGDPRQRFSEDKLRLLRGVRMAARFEMEIEPHTLDAIVEMAPEIVVVSAERIADELRKILADQHRSRGMALFMDVGLARAVLPELLPLRDGEPSAWRHILDVLGHLGPAPSVPLAFAGLLHRIEPVARVRKIAERLRMSNDEQDRICWLCENHRALVDAPRLRLSRVKPLLAHPGCGELLTLHRAIASASKADCPHVVWCEDRLREWDRARLNPPPLLTGNDLMNMGLEPGPLFKRLLDAVREAHLDETISTPEEARGIVDRLLAEEA